MHLSSKPRSLLFIHLVSFLNVSKTSVKRGAKAKLDLSKPIISNSHVLIALSRSKASYLEPHILKLNIVELKVEMVGIHEKRLRKCLSKLKGIEKVEVDGNSQKVVVTGYAHKNKILKAVRKAGLKADFWSAQNELLNAYVSASYANLRFNNFSIF
ncbi:Heavy metal-associated isoprenylated plant protein 28, partial [Mucuna pruriens]